MPYFSFIIDDNAFLETIKGFGSFDLKVKYYSKNTKLWSLLNKFSKKKNIQLKKEIRLRANNSFRSILFCLPPNLGLGDAVEYSLAIKSIVKNKKYKKIGVAHVGKYDSVFKKLFNIDFVCDYVSEEFVKSFDTTFHFTLEINQLKFQKYNRQDIEELITNYFNVPLYRKKINKYNYNKNIKVISIFPVSNSPLRTIPLFLINSIINNFINKYKIEVYLDESTISNYIFNNINLKKDILFYYPKTYQSLINKIKNIEFGIFPDSGPLHIAKIYNKKGILILSSVKKEILLNNFSSIKAIESKYRSDYCEGPCGLVNVFEYKNKAGCYDSLCIKKDEILKSKNLKKLQRGSLKNNYLDLYIRSTNCYKNFDDNKIKLFINEELNN